MGINIKIFFKRPTVLKFSRIPAESIFFVIFTTPPPQMINGRPLSGKAVLIADMGRYMDMYCHNRHGQTCRSRS